MAITSTPGKRVGRRREERLESVEEAGFDVFDRNADGFCIGGAIEHADNFSLGINDRRAGVTNAGDLCGDEQPFQCFVPESK